MEALSAALNVLCTVYGTCIGTIGGGLLRLWEACFVVVVFACFHFG